MSRAAARSPGRRLQARRALARLLCSRSGVSAVEFALVAPVLVLMAIATADAGMAIYQKMHAPHRSCRQASDGPAEH